MPVARLCVVLAYSEGMSQAADVSPGGADLLITPWGWALSMLIGAWVLLRTRPRVANAATRE